MFHLTLSKALALALVFVVAAPADDGLLFEQAAPGPLIPRSDPGAWDYAYNDPGAVLVHDGKLHMFNNGFDGWPTTSGIGYYVSEDGLTWDAQSDGPIFRSREHEFDGFALVATSAVVTDAGEWRLYVTQLKAEGPGQVRGVRFRVLVAKDPLGGWELRDEPALSPGSASAWDGAQISDPMVVREADGYRMYYSGFDADGVRRIGLAESDDGLTFTKHDDGATTATPVAASDPVLVPSLAWETSVHQPSVLKTGGGYVMTYRVPFEGNSMRLGLAQSSDGLTWTKRDEPCYAPNSIAGNALSHITALVEFEGSVFLYVDAFVGGGFSQPYVLVCDASEFEER